MNTHAPTAEEFLAQTEPDEEETPSGLHMSYRGVELTGTSGTFHIPPLSDQAWEPGPLVQIPPDPMERVAEALETLVRLHANPLQTVSAPSLSQFIYEGVSAADTAAEIARVQALVSERNELHEAVGAHAGDMWREQVQSLTEALHDETAKLQTLTQVISDVEAALGKSKAAPALAAKAVIEAWKNPKVEDEGDGEVLEESPEQEAATLTVQDPYVSDPRPDDGEYASTEGHTRTPHESGPDFCRECSGELQEWITWPCPAVIQESRAEAGHPIAADPEGIPVVPQQPAHNAPVEEWREYARALGFAGPEIDKANRSVIRTTLGIAQPVPEAGA